MTRSIFSELYEKMFRHGSWLNLFLGINVVVFLLTNFIGAIEFLSQHADQPISGFIQQNISMPAAPVQLLKKFWTPLTYMFGHSGFGHIFFNMLWLYFIGRLLEEFIAKRHFLLIYLGGGFAGALLFVVAFNLLPAFKNVVDSSVLIGASASVMAVVTATAVLVPDYPVTLLLLGDVRLKFIACAFIVMDIVLLTGNPGGSFAHLGGALFGILYVKQLRSGNDWSKLFSRKSRLKVVSKNNVSKNDVPDQQVVDQLLDKISRSGYESLSKAEKEQLFKASKKDERKK